MTGNVVLPFLEALLLEFLGAVGEGEPLVSPRGHMTSIFLVKLPGQRVGIPTRVPGVGTY